MEIDIEQSCSPDGSTNQNFQFSLSPSHHNAPKGLPRTRLVGGNRLLDEISAAASSIVNPLDTIRQSEWDLSPKPQISHQRLLLRSPSSTSANSSDMIHYAESDIPLPPPPLSADSTFQPYYRQTHDEYEDELDDEEDTVEFQLRSSEENSRQQSEKLRRGGFANSSRQIPLAQLSRHQNHYFSNVDLFQQNDESFNYLKYARASETNSNTLSSPHVRIIDLSFDFDPRSNFDRLMLRSVEYRRLLHNITFEMFGGDTLALLYTSETEMQTFIRVLSHSEMPQGKLHGVLEINGHKLNSRQFGERVAHVSTSNLHSGLTLSEYLNIYSSLIQPATNSFKRQETIEHLIQGLALMPFRSQLVENLGVSEVQRLKLASKMLLDTDLLICENFLKDMDLYDLAFVIDFIRDWAQRLKRIVVIAINPPTMEILTMFSKAAILTCGGRFVYMGESAQMTGYFHSIGYNCPPFKNPCDYFVDLVTHDVLTLESARESMTRIRTLSEIWTHKMPVLHPPRGNIVSPKIQHAGSVTKTLLVYKLFWYRVINRPLSLFYEITFSILMSLLIGWLFLQLTLEQRFGINDRQGFLCAILLICQMPLALLGTRTVINDWPLIEHATSFYAFNPRHYLFAKIAFDLPISTLTAIAFAMPCYIMANQNKHIDNEITTLISFVILVYINFLFCRYIAWCFAFLAKTVVSGALQYCMAICVLLIFSGFIVHSDEQLLPQIQIFNPIKVLAAELMRASFLGKSKTIELVNWVFDTNTHQVNPTEITVKCRRPNKILAHKLKQIPIYTATQCLQTTGAEALRFSGFMSFTPDYKNATFLLIGVSIMILVSLIALVHQRHITQKPISIRTVN